MGWHRAKLKLPRQRAGHPPVNCRFSIIRWSQTLSAGSGPQWTLPYSRTGCRQRFWLVPEHRLTVLALPPGRTGWTGRCSCGATFGTAYSRGRVEEAYDKHLEAQAPSGKPEPSITE